MSVCSLSFSVSATQVTKASSATAADGSFTVVAIDPNSTASIWMSLGSDFTYGRGRPRDTYASGDEVTFEDLAPGSYTVYARNSTSCLATIVVRIEATYNYVPRHRILFDRLIQSSYNPSVPTYKFDIEDSEFTGTVTEEKAGSSPVVLSWRNEANQDPFTSVIPSQVDVSLISPTDAYFEHLYTYDERRFRGSLYEYIGGSYVLIWQGYILPALFKEQYWQNTNYEVKFTFTDGLAELKNKLFTDSSGNFPSTRISIFDAILFCLQKTNVELHIWEAVNIINTSVNTGVSDSVLKQAYFDARVYQTDEDPTCATVLESLLRNVKSRVYQSDGKWHIELVSQKAASEILTRIYDFDGAFDSTSTVTQRIMLRKPTAPGNKLMLNDRSGMIETVSRYGTYLQTYNLSIEEENNLLEYGNFELVDVANGQLKGWVVNTEDVIDGAYSYGVETISPARGDSRAAFYAAFSNLAIGATVQNQKIELQSQYFSLTYPASGAFNIKVKFDLYTRPLYTGPYIYFDFSLEEALVFTGTPYYLQAKEIHKDSNGLSLVKPLTTDLVDNKYLRIYIDDHLSWKTIEVDISIPNADACNAYQLRLRTSSNPIYDFSSITAFKALSTSGKGTQTYANRYRVLDTSIIRSYTLVAGTDSESLPNIVRPDDYGSYGSSFVWKLDESYAIPTITDEIGITLGVAEWLQSILIDNVRISYFPERLDPEKEIVTSLTINSAIPPIFEEELLHGDIEINNGIDINYALISRSFLSNSSGVPFTGGWRLREGEGDGFYLTKLNGDLVKDFYNEKRILLTGTTDTRLVVPSFYNSVYEVRSGRVYVNSSLSVDLYNITATHELIEMLKGEPILDEGDPDLPGDPGGPDPIEPPVRIREHTNEFSNEFA